MTYKDEMHIPIENLGFLGEAPTLSPLIEHREKNHMHTAALSQEMTCTSPPTPSQGEASDL